ncbi:LOW QUALITY PROTEIN: hypothetical protein HID58_072665 [Brassica napus]|uniref:TFIIS central domain-containing protein n=1 Tax=Brassica napus TaxID=3708 RepID=A0ABQ7Z585_BRANA|nr:LOW QUALITY PROTEIN: hypothetical protein HID58_072665 [Brassica napus]
MSKKMENPITKQKTKKRKVRRGLRSKERRMEKHEFLELFEAATKAAKSASRGDAKNSPAVSRCVEAIKHLGGAPESLAYEMVIDRKYPQIGKSHGLFTEHQNPRIQSEGKILYSLWLRYLYATGRKQGSRPRDRTVVKKEKKLVEEEMISRTTGDSNRDKVREILHKSLSKVAVEMKEGVVSCDSWTVAASVESAISILFNMGDSSNPDLRRKVMFGEISGERLVTMEKEEMASHKIQLQVQNIKEKARAREENRVKSMMMFQSDSMIMT